MIEFEDMILAAVPAPSDFRLFCHEKWYEHKDEIFLWTNNMVKYDASYYFKQHRWMLREMFRAQVNNNA
jgi:hypothetical protein|tara:strand:- start:284 stop:490 length:207 start_codon:yes stop_codon:yes gene_type:complete